MTKVKLKQINFLFQLTLLACFFSFNAKADVVYAIPLKSAEHQIGNLLEWSTSFEQNSKTFMVERSKDGITFKNVGTINAAGSSDQSKNYRFLDLGVNDKKLFYRLKQIDQDGTSSFSQTIIVKKELSNQFMVVAMSSPVTNKQFDITVDAIENIELNYIVKNKKGAILSTNQQRLYAGLNDLQIDFSDESEGLYFVILKIGQEEEQLVVQKVEDPVKKKPNLATKEIKKGG